MYHITHISTAYTVLHMVVTREMGREAIWESTGSYISLVLLGGVEGVDRVKGVCNTLTLSKLGKKCYHHRIYARKWSSPEFCSL
jgi:hypothetical protein